jgi:hypothetical protein
MDGLEQLSAALDHACARLDTMIQNADASEKKDDVTNDDKKEETIKNLTAKIANLEERLKNAESNDEEVKNAATVEAVKNIAGQILNILRNSDNDDDDDDDDESVKNKGIKNKGVKNTDKEDDPVSNFAKQVANILKNACDKKDEVDNEDKEEEKIIANLLARLNNIEQQLKNSDKEDEVKNTKDDDESVKNKGVKNTDKEDEESVKNKAVNNAITGILADMVVARQRTIDDLMDTIVTNSGGVYTKAELTGKSTEELQKLSNVLTRSAVPVVNASHSNVHVDAAIVNSNSALDIPSTFPTASK